MQDGSKRPPGEPAQVSPGTPSSESTTRRAILQVAQREISEHGIDGVSIRNIARQAGVDPRLVRHYFGSKERLLLHAVQVGDDPLQLAQRIATGSPRTVGRRTARALVEHWDNSRVAMPYRARLAASLTSEEIAGLIQEEFVASFFGTLAKTYSPDRPQYRAALAAAEVIGMALCRYVVADPVLLDCDQDELVRQMGRSIQHYLTADLNDDPEY